MSSRAFSSAVFSISSKKSSVIGVPLYKTACSQPSSPLEMFFFVFRLLLVFALLGAVLAGDPCSECTPRRPNGCCRGPSGTCCWTRKKRDVESQEDVEPIDFKPLEE
ncbi:hypothetical protein Y032_0077g1106 [Ancylostoma ceylanicum]|uniref:Uncharacterized protein n=1 Tax=Ancylostoma ceylanicum TaxID=53326 RepID=A0A016TU26_9BILA|nr:hypothetical protein Y032_0077g1106 [Ancylostoma ceylanicum]